MTKLVCTMLEELVEPNNRKSTNKLDKKEMAMAVLTKLFNLSALEVVIVSKNMDFVPHHSIRRRNNRILFRPRNKPESSPRIWPLPSFLIPSFLHAILQANLTMIFGRIFATDFARDFAGVYT
jgi:hypothetical protein